MDLNFPLWFGKSFIVRWIYRFDGLMDNRAQISVEYLIMVGLGIIIAAIAIILAMNLFGVKESIKNLIQTFRNRTIGMG